MGGGVKIKSDFYDILSKCTLCKTFFKNNIKLLAFGLFLTQRLCKIVTFDTFHIAILNFVLGLKTDYIMVERQRKKDH